MRWIVLVARLAVFVVLTGMIAISQPFLLPFPLIRDVWPVFYYRIVLKLLGVRLRIWGPRPTRGTLLVCNHMSWFDIVMISAATPVSFIAKSDVKGWPVFGQLTFLQRTVFVVRRRTKSGMKQREVIRKRLEAGDRLVLFAEGTSSDGMRVLPFKSSLFSAVVDADKKKSVNVQPMTLAYRAVHGIAMGRRQRAAYAWIGDATFLPHFLFVFSTPPLTVDIMFHPPLPTNMLDDRKKIAAATEGAVRHGFDKIFTGALADETKNG